MQLEPDGGVRWVLLHKVSLGIVDMPREFAKDVIVKGEMNLWAMKSVLSVSTGSLYISFHRLPQAESFCQAWRASAPAYRAGWGCMMHA